MLFSPVILLSDSNAVRAAALSCSRPDGQTAVYSGTSPVGLQSVALAACFIRLRGDTAFIIFHAFFVVPFIIFYEERSLYLSDIAYMYILLFYCSEVIMISVIIVIIVIVDNDDLL